MKEQITFLQLSSLEKVFLSEDYKERKETKGITALKGERVSYQIFYTGGKEIKTEVEFKYYADKSLAPIFRLAENVPCAMPAYRDESDDYYLKKEAGLFPDVLYPLENRKFDVLRENCHSLFVTVEIPQDIKAGVYPIEIDFLTEEQSEKKVFEIEVLNAILPKQELIYTQWFHADCIAGYYNFEIFSEQHWRMIEKFIKMAAHTGINMILTPLFTLPLDTQIGEERPTLQLIDVTHINGKYSFGFERLKRWIDICKKNGMKKFEMSHLFTQWGTGCTPKIEAETENGKKNIFGWHMLADTTEYRDFLNSFLPTLVSFLEEEGIYEDTYFHISDEPDFKRHFEIYKKEKGMVEKFIPCEKIIDAISHYEFCECGLVKTPIAVTSSVEEFFKHGIKDLWAYYCCGPANKGYSNRFIAMPSGRNRIMGVQLFKYNLKGFLQWGYNFYYSQLSKRKINPFLVTDGDEAFPSGDPFSVYPGEDGPIESIRSVVFYEGLQDLSACSLLEKYIGREEVNKILEEEGEITFNEYPRENSGVLEIRERINRKIKECI